MGTMKRAFTAQQRLFSHGDTGGVGCPDDARIGKLATVLGRVAAAILALFLVVSAVVSVVMNHRYTQVARQHAQVAVSSDMAGRVPAVASVL
jgi:multidrug resistance efflux pump